MKILIYFLMGMATALLIYNLTFINFSDPMAGESAAALVGILASSCVIILMLILLVSRAIAQKAKGA